MPETQCVHCGAYISCRQNQMLLRPRSKAAAPRSPRGAPTASVSPVARGFDDLGAERYFLVNEFTNPPLSPFCSMKKVSEPAIGRLSLYLRLLVALTEAGVGTISSEDLAAQCGTTAAQVRKDLSRFGSFGKRGLGYSVPELETHVRSILGLGRRWPVALVGAGRIGTALLGYESFRRQGFNIEAVFDSDPLKVGTRWNGLEVQGDATLEAVVAERGIEIAVVAVPGDEAQAVVNRLVGAGIRGILNFAPTRLDVPSSVVVKSVDMAAEMERLSYALTRSE
jgi:redox-sensing transcriptional repressor